MRTEIDLLQTVQNMNNNSNKSRNSKGVSANWSRGGAGPKQPKSKAPPTDLEMVFMETMVKTHTHFITVMGYSPSQDIFTLYQVSRQLCMCVLYKCGKPNQTTTTQIQ